MAFYGYKNKYYLNMSHSINKENPRAGQHFHTLEITLYIQEKNTAEPSENQNESDHFFLYDEMEKGIFRFFEDYEGAFFNELPEFSNVSATIEHIGDMFYTALRRKLIKEGFILKKLEISETPSRVYAVSKFLKRGHTDSDADYTDKRLKHFILASMPYVKQRQDEAGITEEVWQKTEKKTDQNNEEQLIETKEDGSEEKDAETTSINPKKGFIHTLLTTILAVVLFLGAAGAFGYYLYVRGDFPFGQDAYLVMGKAEYLFEQLCMGRVAPMYMESWYNGYQFFVTTPPVSYYLFVGFRFLTGDIITAYYALIAFSMFVGAIGWLILGKHWKNLFSGILAGMFWLFLPSVLNNFVFYGNPMLLLLTALIPYVMLAMNKCCERGKKRDYFFIGILFLPAILTDTFHAFILYIAICIYGLFYGKETGKIIHAIRAALAGGFGILLTGPWLFIAIRNGIFNSTRLLESGFSISVILALVLVCGVLLGGKKSRTAFWLGLLFWGLSACGKISVAQNVPGGLYLLNSFYAVISSCFLLLAMIQWKNSKKIICILFFAAMLFGGVWQSRDWFLQKSKVSYQDYVAQMEENGLKEAVDFTDDKMLFLELDSDNAFLSYYVSSVGKGISSSYQLKSQDAVIEKNILQMENALYIGYYPYVFDRALEGGNDTVVIGTKELSLEKDGKREKLVDNARILGYNLIKESDEYLVFHRSLYDEQIQVEDRELNSEVKEYADIGIVTNYKGLAIGNSASEISMLFPTFLVGNSANIEDYPLEELKRYKKLLLAGFTYYDRESAEKLIREVADSGVLVYIDMSQAPVDPLNNRSVFFDVSGQVISFRERFQSLVYKGKLKNADSFLVGSEKWDTVYLDNLDVIEGYSWNGGKRLAFCGKKGKINFLSMNLIYHGVETRDEEVLSIIYDFIGEVEGVLPEREIVPINILFDGRNIHVESPRDNVNTTWAFQSSFSNNRKIRNENNYLIVDSGKSTVSFAYGQTWYSAILTLVILSVSFALWQFLRALEREILEKKTT